jgi:hypothetical protein
MLGGELQSSISKLQYKSYDGCQILCQGFDECH